MNHDPSGGTQLNFAKVLNVSGFKCLHVLQSLLAEIFPISRGLTQSSWSEMVVQMFKVAQIKGTETTKIKKERLFFNA